MAEKKLKDDIIKWSVDTKRRVSKQFNGIADTKIYIDINSYEQDLKLHYHEFYEIVYVMCGSATHIINGEAHSACMGDLFLLNYDTAHTLVDVRSNYKMISISFLPDIVDPSLADSQNVNDLLMFLINEEIFEHDSNAGFIVLHACAKEFETMLEEMYSEYANQRDYSPFILRHLMSVVLGRVYRIASQKYEISSQDNLTGVMHYIDQNYMRPCKLSDLAKIALLSPSYLSAQFKIRFGVSISDYIHMKRMENACSLMKTTDDSILAIMREVGYNDPKNFYRIFKSHTGMTPGDYRESCRQKRIRF